MRVLGLLLPLAAALALASTAAGSSAEGEWWLQGATATTQGVNATAVWSRTQGHGVVVADLDSGADATVPDLKGAILPGRSFFPHMSANDDFNGHGTEVAGVIAAHGPNVFGVAPQAKVLPLTVLDIMGTGYLPGVERALRYTAARHDVRVVNLSLGMYKDVPAFRRALHAVLHAGKLVVAAAGNEAIDSSRSPSYPCGWRGVLCVGATGPLGALTSWSDYGKRVVAAAPGLGIGTTETRVFGPIPIVGKVDGTSYSCGIVSGVAALLFSAHPEATATQVLHAILAGLRPVPDLEGLIWFPGIVDAGRALAALDHELAAYQP